MDYAQGLKMTQITDLASNNKCKVNLCKMNKKIIHYVNKFSLENTKPLRLRYVTLQTITAVTLPPHTI